MVMTLPEPTPEVGSSKFEFLTIYWRASIGVNTRGVSRVTSTHAHQAKIPVSASVVVMKIAV